MLINRVHIYIFGILKHQGLIPCTRFWGVKRLPAEKVLKDAVRRVLTRVRSSSWAASGSQSPWSRGRRRWQIGRARGCLQNASEISSPPQLCTAETFLVQAGFTEIRNTNPPLQDIWMSVLSTYRVVVGRFLISFLVRFVVILTDVRPLVHLVDPVSCVARES